MRINVYTGLILSGLLLAATSQAQSENLSLELCHELARDHAPRMDDRELIRAMGDIKEEQAGLSWFPSLQLNGKASYQSDVVELDVSGLPPTVEFPTVPHDQYSLNLDLRQNIYDGGSSSSRKAYERALTEAELQEVEVDLYGIKGMVNRYYFPILVLQVNRQNLDLHQENLEARRSSMEVAVDNGALLVSELKVIRVEILKIRQNIIEVESQKRAYLDALEVLCGRAFPDDIVLRLPAYPLELEQGLTRPEHRLFELQEASLEAGKDLAHRRRMPTLYAFGQTGYGQPGYNLMSTDWDFYYMLGAGLSWTLWDWGQSRKEKQVLGYRQEVIRNARSSFDQQLDRMLVQEARNIEQYLETIQMEEEVLQLQEEISEHAASSLANGSITASDYIYELNKESMSRIRLASNRIQLMQSIVNYRTIQGKL